MSTAWKSWWQQYGLTATLASVGVVALGTIGIETDWGRALRMPAPDARAGAASADLAPMLPPFKLGELDAAFRESGERPLFTPTRRPPLSTSMAAAPQMKRGQYKLAGTVVNAGLSVAYLVEVAGNKTIRVNKGSEIVGQSGLMVDSVEPSRVVLKMGEETEILELKSAASPPKPATPAGVPGATPATGIPGQPVPVANVAIPPPTAAQPVRPFAPNASQLVPLPGMAALPGFMAGAPGTQPLVPSAGANATVAPPDANAAAQRRRRFQPTPPPAAPQ